MTILYKEVRSAKNLFAAWRHVKRSALSSKNPKIRGSASEFEHAHHKHIKRIADELRERRFKFDDAEGVLKDKKVREAAGKNARPIAIATVRSRVVQRAILQILQPRSPKDPRDINTRYTPKDDPRLGKLNLINRSKYGVGGLMSPYGGVKPAVNLVMSAMANGGSYYYQSDIKEFFTKIPTQTVVDFILRETGDELLSNLFSEGLAVNLKNKDELLLYANLFPANGIGVAQGSSLSALAGNILLYDMDHELNEMGVTAVRYVDDLLIVSPNSSSLARAIEHATSRLKRFNFSLYPAVPGSTKASQGKCVDAIKFLGCTLQPNRCVPSKASIDKLCGDVNDLLSTSKRDVYACIEKGKPILIESSRSHTLSKISRKVFGWQKSFAFCTEPQAFQNLDNRVRQKVLAYEHWLQNKCRGLDDTIRMEVLGIPSTAAMFLANANQKK